MPYGPPSPRAHPTSDFAFGGPLHTVTYQHIKARLLGPAPGGDGLPAAVWIGELYEDNPAGQACPTNYSKMCLADPNDTGPTAEIYKLAMQFDVPVSMHSPLTIMQPAPGDCGCSASSFFAALDALANQVGDDPPVIVTTHFQNFLIEAQDPCVSDVLRVKTCQMKHAVAMLRAHPNAMVEFNAWRPFGAGGLNKRYLPIPPGYFGDPDFVKFVWEFADRIVMGRDNNGLFYKQGVQFQRPHLTSQCSQLTVDTNYVHHVETGLAELMNAIVAAGLGNQAQATCVAGDLVQLNMFRLVKQPKTCTTPLPPNRQQTYSWDIDPALCP